MADRSTISYAVKTFKMQLGLVPNMQMLKKSIRDMIVSLPKKVQEGTAADGLLTTFDALAKSMAETKLPFEKVTESYNEWADKALDWISKQDDENLEAKRGRQGELDQEIELFGVKQLTSQHAGSLIAGSKLQTYFEGGLPENMSQADWEAFIKTTNMLSRAIRDLVPDDKRPKRESKNSTPEVSTDETKEENKDEGTA